MYAIVEVGGKQHRIEVGQRIAVERVWPGVEPGNEVLFDQILLVRDEHQVKLGDPFVLKLVTEMGRRLRDVDEEFNRLESDVALVGGAREEAQEARVRPAPFDLRRLSKCSG
jgi:hypothetical protein